MKFYVIMRTEKGEISRIDRYDKNRISAESIQDKIEEWTGMNKPELIIDLKTIEVLNYIFRNYDDTDLQAKCENLEEKIIEIRRIVG